MSTSGSSILDEGTPRTLKPKPLTFGASAATMHGYRTRRTR